MATTPFPLPRQTRETTILVGNGTAGPYGPTAFKVFDVADVAVFAKPSGSNQYFDLTANVTVVKTTDAPMDTVSVTFATAQPNTTSFVIQARRIAERSIAVTRAGTVDSQQTEKELSKIAATLSELRRDVTRGGSVVVGNDGQTLVFGGGQIHPGADQGQIEAAAGNAATAAAAALDAVAARDAALAAATSLQAPKATVADIEADTPLVNPIYYQTQYFDGTQQKGSGAKYIRTPGNVEPSHAGKARNSNGIWYEINEDVLNLTMFGARASFPAAVNMAILKAAIGATRTGGTLRIPNIGAVYTVDTTGGLSGAALIDRKMTIIIDGHLKANYSANEINPAYIFHVTADDVVFDGSGTIEGDGALDVASAGGSSIIYPGLVRVTGSNNFRFRNVKIYRHPKIGVNLVNSTRAIIGPCEIQGGPTTFHGAFLPPDFTVADPAYVGGYYVGVTASGGGDHTFQNIHFTKDAFDGRTVQGIFSSGSFGTSHGNKTINCIAYQPWEKLLYGYGDRQVIASNQVYGVVSAGAGLVDTLTDAIRVWGNSCTVYGNIINGTRGGIQVLDGRFNKIFGNVLTNLRQSGINIQHFTAGDAASTVSFNHVYGNFISRNGSSLDSNLFGVRVITDTSFDVVGCTIENNIIVGFGGTAYAIHVQAQSPRLANGCVVRNNYLSQPGLGIQLSRNVGGLVEGNRIYFGTDIGIDINAGSDCTVSNNIGQNMNSWLLSMSVAGSRHAFLSNRANSVGNIGIQNLTFGTNDCYGTGNQYNAKPLTGAGTLAAAATTTIAHGGVAPNATIDWIGTSSTFALRESLVGFYTGVNVNDFNIVTGNGSANAGGETFRYEIIQ